jgi:hypothetical protein
LKKSTVIIMYMGSPLDLATAFNVKFLHLLLNK